ncbi:phage protein NinX family protein [Morganella morganii]|uniref:phage protein NinX family protein n=1 Tax=Morganella morganii TaxID=582 RepID=UPI0034E47ABC
MNKYRDKSDYEINKLIARLNDGIHIDDEITDIDCYIQSQSSPSSVLSCNGHISYLIYDFCNNPSDAMPIVIENGISLIFDTGCKAWVAGIAYWVDGCEWQISYEVERMNQYRAAMELFLMMKDAENEK